MPKFEIVYFTGCPLVPRARHALLNAGIDQFAEINQDKLAPGDERKGLSSPSILMDGRLLAGSRNSPASCSIVDWSAVTNELKSILGNRRS